MHDSPVTVSSVRAHNYRCLNSSRTGALLIDPRIDLDSVRMWLKSSMSRMYPCTPFQDVLCCLGRATAWIPESDFWNLDFGHRLSCLFVYCCCFLALSGLFHPYLVALGRKRETAQGVLKEEVGVLCFLFHLCFIVLNISGFIIVHDNYITVCSYTEYEAQVCATKGQEGSNGEFKAPPLMGSVRKVRNNNEE